MPAIKENAFFTAFQAFDKTSRFSLNRENRYILNRQLSYPLMQYEPYFIFLFCPSVHETSFVERNTLIIYETNLHLNHRAHGTGQCASVLPVFSFKGNLSCHGIWKIQLLCRFLSSSIIIEKETITEFFWTVVILEDCCNFPRFCKLLDPE